MTLEQLESLLKRAEDVTRSRITLGRDSAGKWNVVMAGPPHTRDRYSVELGDCVALLKQWATLPKPLTLTLTLPTDYCETVLVNITKAGSYECHRAGSLHNALVEALAPYQQPE